MRRLIHNIPYALNAPTTVDCATRATSCYSPNGYSIAFWVKGSIRSGSPRLFSEGNSGIATQHLDLQIDSSSAQMGALGVSLINDAGTTLINNVRANKPVFDGQWHFFVLTDTGGLLKIYIDGALQTLNNSLTSLTYTPSTTTLNIQGLLCLARNTLGSVATCAMAEFRTWSVVLTDQEISDLYYNNIVPEKSSLTGEILFTEGTGTQAADTSVTKIPAIFSGNPTWSTDTPMVSRSQA